MGRLFITFIFLISVSNSFAKTIKVCHSCNFSLIKLAIASATTNDIILIQKGTYLEHNLEINKSLTIKGEKGVVIDGQMAGTILMVSADNVTITNLHIKNVGHSYTKDFSAILVYRSKNFNISNNILTNVFFGIKIEKSKIGTISQNNISGTNTTEAGSGNGIHVWHSSKLQIINNNLFHMRDGIYFEFVKESTILNNDSHNNLRYGLHFMFSNNNSYLNNKFNNNGAGVAVMFSKFIIMKQNTFQNNWGSASYGLLLKEIYDAEIIENKFIKNTIAINTEGSTRINYTSNLLQANGWAVKVTGACYKNIYVKNNFVANTIDVAYNSKINDNKFEGNYWSSYTGYDLDKNGVGDVPYRPVKLFSYIVNKSPETIVLMRSLFVDIMNFSEKVSPVFTPADIVDEFPAMRMMK